MNTKLKQGLIHLYTGNGKGKTTAALGLSLRAVGMGLRVYFVQFLKPQSAPSGEVNIASKLAPQFTLLSPHEDSFLGHISDDMRKKNKTICFNTLTNVKTLMQAGKYDLFVLDEAVNALNLKLIEWAWIEELINNKPQEIELVLTGQPAPPKLIELADLVSSVEMIKHPYQQGIQSRAGIEY